MQSRKSSGFGWALTTAFFAIPTLILLGLSAGFSADSSEWLRRMDQLPPGERFITGQAQLAAGHELLNAPITQGCLAWDGALFVSWSSKNSNDETVSESRTLRAWAAATPFVVVDSRAGVLATIELPRVELLAAAKSRSETGIPAWAEAFEKKDDDVSNSDRTYSWSERTLKPGDTVTFFARGVGPLDGHERLIIYVGTPEAWRSELEGLATASWWTLRIGLALGAVALVCAAFFVRARLRRSVGPVPDGGLT